MQRMKMMRYSLLIMAYTLCIGHFSFSQEPVYNWGPPVTNENTDRNIDQLLSLDDKGFVLLKSKKEITSTVIYWLESFDANLQSTGEKRVAFSEGVMGDSYDLEKIEVVNGTIYAFVSHWHKATGKNSLSIKELTLDAELRDIKELTYIDAEKMGNRGAYTTSFSDDGTKLIVLSELPFQKKTKEKVRLSCFDFPSMELNWSHDEELGWDSKRGTSNDVSVGNDGKGYMFKSVWEKPEWRYALYSCRGNGEWKSHTGLQLEGKRIDDYRLEFDKNNSFFIYATYATDPSKLTKKLFGTWFAHFSKTSDEPTIKIANWSTAILELYGGKKEYIEYLYIKDLLIRDDGKLLVLMEQLRKERDGIPGSTPIKYSYTWNYGSFIALCLDQNTGDLMWWQKFNKKQEVKGLDPDDQYGSFVYHLKEDRLFVFWNNTALSVPSIPPANWTESDGSKFVKHKAFNEKTKHATFMRVIEPDGTRAYPNRKFGLPLFGLHAGAVFEMSLNSSFFFELNGNFVVMATMHNGGKRYRFGFIGL